MRRRQATASASLVSAAAAAATATASAYRAAAAASLLDGVQFVGGNWSINRKIAIASYALHLLTNLVQV